MLTAFTGGDNGRGRGATAARFTRRHPLFTLAAVCAACVAAGNFHPAAGASTALVATLALGRIASRGIAAAALLCGATALTVFLLRVHAQSGAERSLIGRTALTVTAKTLKDARGDEFSWSAPVRLHTKGLPSVLVWWQGEGPPPVAGSRMQAMVDFLPLPAPRNPGEFDRAAWMRRNGIAAVAQTADGNQGTIHTPWLARFGAALRHGFRDRVTLGLDPDSEAAMVIRAVVIGEQPADADTLVAAFRDSGTLHVFSVSGLHVAMVGSIAWLILSQVGVSRSRAVLVIIPMMFGYSWITGNSAPALRSAWMAAIFLMAFCLRRRPDLLNALGAVLLAACLWDGRMLFQTGVQLSYGVVAAIAVGTAAAAKLFAWMTTTDPFLPDRMRSRPQALLFLARRRLAQSLAVAVSAAAGSTPLTWWHFGLATPVSVAAGLVLIPLVFLLLCGALAAVAISPVPGAAASLNRANAMVASLSVRAAEWFSSWPGGHIHRRRLTEPSLIAYDLEQGAGAACFAGTDGGAVLLDCGSPHSFRNVVLPSLRHLGIEPDSVILSHPDGSHLGGGSQVWRSLPLRQVMLPVKLARSPAHREWLHEAPAAGIRVLHASTTMFPLPSGASVEAVHLPDPDAVNVRADERVAVFRVHWQGWKILMTGDAGQGTERRMLDSGADLSADVIIAGKHREDPGLCDDFLDAVRPAALVCSNHAYPAAEQVPASSIRHWNSRGIRVFDQRECGGVTLTTDREGRLRIRGFLQPDKAVLLSPR